MSAINTVNQTQNALIQDFQQLSSGNRINSAADDAAGLAIASRQSVQISSTGQALSNLDNGLSLLQTANSGLGQISDTLQNIRNLVVQAGNSTLSTDDRNALQEQINQGIQNINTTTQNTGFNGQTLLNGSFSTTLQTGPDANDTQALSFADSSATALGIGTIDVTNSSNVSESLTNLDNALNSINTQHAATGSIADGLQSQINYLTDSNISLSSAQSSTQSTDFASTISDAAKNRILLQAGIQALKLYNESQSNKLSLLSPS